MRKVSCFSRGWFCSLLFLCIIASKAFGQCTGYLSQIDFQGKAVVFPYPHLMNNYNQQSSFSIHPDCHLTSQWVKAGAYFSYNGYRVRAESVQISVYLPKNGNIWGYREHNESNVGEPDWSGFWHEPYANGFFCYTVKAQYNGVWYETAFEVTPSGWWSIFEATKEGFKLYIKSQRKN